MDSQFLGSAVEMMILEVIAQGRATATRSRRRCRSVRDGYFELKEGSLYPALHRLERQKLLRVVLAGGRRPAAEVLRADRRGPGGAGRAEAVVARLRGGRQRRPGIGRAAGSMRDARRCSASTMCSFDARGPYDCMDFRDSLSDRSARAPGRRAGRPAPGHPRRAGRPSGLLLQPRAPPGGGPGRGAATCLRTVRRPGGRGPPALARCDEREDHGPARI